MATVTLNPIFKSFSGNIAGIVMYTLDGRQYARVLPDYANPDTEKQRIVRRTFGDAVRSWQSLSPDEKQKYNRKARRLPMNGYNFYISCYMKENITRSNAGNTGRDMFITSCRHLSGFYPASLSVAHTIPLMDSLYAPGLQLLNRTCVD
ncbi:MAG TPA: hypothetical protein PKG60_15480 [Spirochaetota bacterium]|nr:hypothetical protein [Spirochaetota bacterium]